ncbi:MAG: hypothetical protein HY722_15130 [Planctomycetes bacterium]|nr:hypothetical protein [Planctomycetota bacterium]
MVAREGWGEALAAAGLGDLTAALGFGGGEPVREGRFARVIRVALLDGRGVYVKAYRPRPFPPREALRRSKARREYRNLERLSALDVPVVTPVAWCDSGLGMGGPSVLVVEEFPGAVDLRRFFCQDPDAAGREAALGVMEEVLLPALGRLHRAGLCAYTLFDKNVLYRPGASVDRLRLVDLPEVHRVPYPLRRLGALRDLGLLNKGLVGRVGDERRRALLETYRGLFRPGDPSFVEAVERRTERFRHRTAVGWASWKFKKLAKRWPPLRAFIR